MAFAYSFRPPRPDEPRTRSSANRRQSHRADGSHLVRIMAPCQQLMKSEARNQVWRANFNGRFLIQDRARCDPRRHLARQYALFSPNPDHPFAASEQVGEFSSCHFY